MCGQWCVHGQAQPLGDLILGSIVDILVMFAHRLTSCNEPDCKAFHPRSNLQVQSTANNLKQYNGPGFPSVLLTGSNKYIAFTCATGESVGVLPGAATRGLA